jgi:hypothetical protein
MANVLPFSKLPNLKVKVQIDWHIHNGPKCTAHNHNSSCSGRGTEVSCVPLILQSPGEKPYAVYSCTHVHPFKRVR